MDKLPVELLENIFNYLDKSGRNKCKEVCRRWNNILTWSPLYRGERVIRLRRCLLLLDSEPFKSLIEGKASCFDSMKVGQMLRISPECDTFWKPSFSHIVNLEIDQCQSQDFPTERFIAILAGLDHLKFLILRNACHRNFGILNEDFMQLMEARHLKFNTLKLVSVYFTCDIFKSFHYRQKFFKLGSKLVGFCPLLYLFHVKLPTFINVPFNKIKDERLKSLIIFDN